MKIAQIAPLLESVPPKKYGGTERVIYSLTEALVKRGHQVTLFASGDSVTSARLVSVCKKNLREQGLYNSRKAWVILNIGKAYSMQEEFDVIHDHTGFIGLSAASLAATPVLITLHGPITLSEKPIYEGFKHLNFVSISKAQMVPAPTLNFLGTVHNGVVDISYPFSPTSDNYLLFVGRFSPEKGAHFAIQVAEYLNIPLIIAAKLDTDGQKYFQEKIEPKLSSSIRWVGEVTAEERNKLMSKAVCLLSPIDWREPFGLVLTEALACGCPIVAFRRGSVLEIVEEGRVGFIAEDVEEMVEAVKKISKINRSYCRKYALERFTPEMMVKSYEELYKQLLLKKTGANIKEAKRAEEVQKEHRYQKTVSFRS